MSHSSILHIGSSKVLFSTEQPHLCRMVFKDVVHGRGKKASIPGTGRLRAKFCFYFYKLLEKAGIQTQLAKDKTGKLIDQTDSLNEAMLLVTKLNMIPLELIARYVARGHWVDNHKLPLFTEGSLFEPPLVELCLKWKAHVSNLQYIQLSEQQIAHYNYRTKNQADRELLIPQTIEREDPRVSIELAVALNKNSCVDNLQGQLIESVQEGLYLKQLTIQVNSILREFLSSQDWILEDGKFEVGFIPGTRTIVVADEYSQDSLRVRDKAGNALTKDLFRQSYPTEVIYNNYAKLTEAIEKYVATIF